MNPVLVGDPCSDQLPSNEGLNDGNGFLPETEFGYYPVCKYQRHGFALYIIPSALTPSVMYFLPKNILVDNKEIYCVNDSGAPAYMNSSPEAWKGTLEECCYANFQWVRGI